MAWRTPEQAPDAALTSKAAAGQILDHATRICRERPYPNYDLLVSQPDDNIDRRFTPLRSRLPVSERDVASLRDDVTTARMLATAADRDVSEARTELRAHTQVLNALRQTQLEQGHKIDNLEREMRAGFSVLNTGMAQMTTLPEGIAGSGQNQSGD
jgi:chromosome segregation ATPase